MILTDYTPLILLKGKIMNSVVGLFWDNTTGLTMIGTLLLIGLGVGLVWTLISFVTRLVRRVG